MALLLMGVLPLLAKDDVPDIYSEVLMGEDEHDALPVQSAAEQMHDDVLTSIPSLQVLDVASLSSADVVTVDHIFDGGLESREVNSSDIIKHSNLLSTDPTQSSLTTVEADQSKERLEGEGEEIKPSDVEKDEEGEQVKLTEETPSKGETDAEQIKRSDTEKGEEVTEDPPNKDEDEADANVTQAQDEPTPPSDGEDEEEGGAKRVMVDYANKSAGALILERSQSMKGASNLLTNNKDEYAITPCKDKKFVVVGLSEDILVKQIKLSNYELYSSHVKEFQVLGSQTMGQWEDLGTFTASHGNGEQSFELGEPSWARYLKFRFISHHRAEHYCTLTQIRVHGSTMLQGFREQWNEGEDEEKKLEAGVAEESTDEDVVEKTNSQEADTKFATDDSKEPEAVKVDSPVKDDNIEGVTPDATENSETQEPEQIASTPKEAGPEVLDQMKRTDNLQGRIRTLPVPALPPIFDIRTAPIPHALEYARFELPAHRIVNSDRPQRQKALRITAISPDSNGHDFSTAVKDAVKAVVAEASDNVQKVKESSTVSDAVREIQSRIQTTIGKTWELQHTIQTMIGKALPGLKPDWVIDVDPLGDKSEEAEGDDGAESEPQPTGQEESPTEQQDSAEEQEVTVDNSAVDVEMVEGVAKVIGRPAGVDDSVLEVEMSEGLAKVIARYPSAKCLDSLHFPSLKKNVVAKAATGSGTAGSQTGRMEPIFKTLTDEIKALQISQNVHDQFSRALISCYQSIMIEMASELYSTQIQQEDRLSKLEAGLKQMDSKDSFSRIPSGLVYVLSLCLSLSVVAYAQSFLLVKEVSHQLLQLEGGPYILGAMALTAAAVFVMLVRHRRKAAVELPSVRNSPTVSRPRTNGRMPQTRSLEMFPAE